MISRELLIELVADCDKRAPEEGCGLIANGEVVPCKNIHPSPQESFAIAAEDYAFVSETVGEIDCVYHSHTNDRDGFSPADIKSCKQTNLPWLVYNTNSKNWKYADPRGNEPYVGREWVYGIYDCYSLTRDFYRREFGISLDDFERGEDKEWLSPNWNMFGENYASQGFVEIESPCQKGDIVLMKMDTRWPNHFAILKGEGVRLYHHLAGRRSEEATYGKYWRQFTAKVLRHRELL